MSVGLDEIYIEIYIDVRLAIDNYYAISEDILYTVQ